MPRHDPAGSVAKAVEGLVHAITRVIDDLRTAVGGTGPSAAGGIEGFGIRTAGKRGPGPGNAKHRAALKRSWASYNPAQRAERVRKMLAGRGLKPKGSATKEGRGTATPKAVRAPSAKRAATATPSKGGAWASMTPEQRAERIAKMRAGRGLTPRDQ